MYKIINVFAVLFLFGAQVSFARQMPEWVSVPKNVYDPEEYFSYVGKSKDKAEAELLAVEGIASVFEQDVNTVSTVSSRMEKASDEGKVSLVKSGKFNSRITRTVNLDSLVGVEIKEYWTDDEKNIYAIAVLDKKTASALYSETILKNNAEIEKLLTRETDDEFSFENYAAIDFAGEIALLNEKYLKRLSVIDFDSFTELEKKCRKSYDINLIRQKISRQIPVYVFFENDNDERIKQCFSEMFNSFGFRTSDDRNERYSFIGKVKFTKNIPRDKSSVQCKYVLDASLKDTLFEQKLFTVSLNGRNADISYENATDRALRAIENKTLGDVSDKFDAFLKNISVY